MSFVSNFINTKLMQTTINMNESDLFELKENYVDHLIEGMDIDNLPDRDWETNDIRMIRT